MRRRKKKDKDFKRLEAYTRASIKCKRCGHTILPTKERELCTYCGYYVYKDAKTEFKYKMLEKSKKNVASLKKMWYNENG